MNWATELLEHMWSSGHSQFEATPIFTTGLTQPRSCTIGEDLSGHAGTSKCGMSWWKAKRPKVTKQAVGGIRELRTEAGEVGFI